MIGGTITADNSGTNSRVGGQCIHTSFMDRVAHMSGVRGTKGKEDDRESSNATSGRWCSSTSSNAFIVLTGSKSTQRHMVGVLFGALLDIKAVLV